MSKTFDHNSIFGGLNLLKRFDNRFLIEKGERPPYPIVQSNPGLLDVLNNFNTADFGILVFFGFIGFPVARFALKGLFFSSEFYRRQIFNTVWGSVIAWGFLIGMQNSYYRLQGLVDNGLQWKRKERKLRKYDFSSEFEDNSIWKFFRLRE